MSDPSYEDAPRLPTEERLARVRLEETLIQLAAEAELRRPDSRYYTDERIVDWISAEIDSPQRAHDGWEGDKITAVARRIRARAEGIRLKVLLIDGRPQIEQPVARGLVADVMSEAKAVRAAPRLELGAAAGSGRDLWDEPCEQWVRVPEGVPSGSYVALQVVGDSMDPLMHTGDSVLVRIGNRVERDKVILARLPDSGYVVKRVGRVARRTLELLSINDAFSPIRVARDAHTVVGTVILRWCPHSATS